MSNDIFRIYARVNRYTGLMNSYWGFCVRPDGEVVVRWGQSALPHERIYGARTKKALEIWRAANVMTDKGYKFIGEAPLTDENRIDEERLKRPPRDSDSPVGGPSAKIDWDEIETSESSVYF